MTNYNLNQTSQTETENKSGLRATFRKLKPLIAGHYRLLVLAGLAIIVNSVVSLIGPILVGRAIDQFIPTGDYRGLFWYGGILLVTYLIAFITRYVQTIWMGTVGQTVLFNLRNAIFNKLQELPLAFFNQNKAGDLISRINNDTDKLNQFFSQTLMQFIGSAFVMVGAGIFLVVINPRLGLVTLAPALFLVIVTQLISPWVKARNAVNLQSVGGMSAEIQESLDNFKVIVAFNRRDYFREKFAEANQQNYQSAVSAGLANNIFNPIYGLSANLGQLAVLAYGLYLIGQNQFTVGLLVSFLSYATIFYQPLRQIASLWANFQVALAGWDRIARILSLSNDLTVQAPASKKGLSADKADQKPCDNAVIAFRQVSFRYPDGDQDVLHQVNFELEHGKIYAFVGPTGGGKTTTASLMSRLYDPTEGVIDLCGRDLRSYSPAERSAKIGFILQEPFLFSGTIGENLLYGFPEKISTDEENIIKKLTDAGLSSLLNRFPEGVRTKINIGDDSISLGQKQLIAFMRVVLRQPDLLILDEATANIDTVTEQQLQQVLDKLPAHTTRVIIAHRLNTIANADVIYFVNAGRLVRAGSMEQAVDMLMHEKRQS